MPGIQAPLALRWVLHSPGSPPYKFDPVQVRDGREFDYLRVSMAEAKVAGCPTSQAGPGDHLPSTPRSHPQPLAFSGSDSLAPRETLDHSGSHSFQRGNNSRPGRGGGKRVSGKDQLEGGWGGKKKTIVLMKITS